MNDDEHIAPRASPAGSPSTTLTMTATITTTTTTTAAPAPAPTTTVTAEDLISKRRKELFGDCALIEIIHLHDCLRGAIRALEEDIAQLTHVLLLPQQPQPQEEMQPPAAVAADGIVVTEELVEMNRAVATTTTDTTTTPTTPTTTTTATLQQLQPQSRTSHESIVGLLERRVASRFQVIWNVFRAHSSAEDEFIWPALRSKAALHHPNKVITSTTTTTTTAANNNNNNNATRTTARGDQEDGSRYPSSQPQQQQQLETGTTAMSAQAVGYAVPAPPANATTTIGMTATTAANAGIEQEEYEEDHADEERMFSEMDRLLTQLRHTLQLQQHQQQQHANANATTVGAGPEQPRVVDMVQAILQAARSLSQHLMAHLEKEETQCMPLVVQHLSKNEIHDLVGKIMGKRSADTIANIMTMAVQILNDEERDEMVRYMKQSMAGTFFDRWLLMSGWVSQHHRRYHHHRTTSTSSGSSSCNSGPNPNNTNEVTATAAETRSGCNNCRNQDDEDGDGDKKRPACSETSLLMGDAAQQDNDNEGGVGYANIISVVDKRIKRHHDTTPHSNNNLSKEDEANSNSTTPHAQATTALDPTTIAAGVAYAAVPATHVGITSQAELEKLIRAIVTNPALTPAQKNTTIQGLRDSVWKSNQRHKQMHALQATTVVNSVDGVPPPFVQQQQRAANTSSSMAAALQQSSRTRRVTPPSMYFRKNAKGRIVLVWHSDDRSSGISGNRNGTAGTSMTPATATNTKNARSSSFFLSLSAHVPTALDASTGDHVIPDCHATCSSMAHRLPSSVAAQETMESREGTASSLIRIDRSSSASSSSIKDATTSSPSSSPSVIPLFSAAELAPTYHDGAAGSVLGCPHYARACKLRHPVSGRLYTCRLCCEQQRELPMKDPDEPLDRYSVTEIMCMKCNALQPAEDRCINPDCESAGKPFARYFCRICHLYDDGTRPIFHCPYCNTCRLGLGLGIDFRHCMRCNACVALSDDNNHRCIPQKLQGTCPICHELLFQSTQPLRGLKCGHVMHLECFTRYRRGHSYTCPLCMRSMEDMRDYFALLDMAVRMQPMPVAYLHTMSNIYCQDCCKTGQVSYHFVGQKCPHCSSYNTREMGRFHNSHHHHHHHWMNSSSGAATGTTATMTTTTTTTPMTLTMPANATVGAPSPMALSTTEAAAAAATTATTLLASYPSTAATTTTSMSQSSLVQPPPPPPPSTHYYHFYSR